MESGSAEAVAAAAEGLRSSGFVNYYGLQRFGTGAVPTHRCTRAGTGARLLLTRGEGLQTRVLCWSGHRDGCTARPCRVWSAGWASAPCALPSTPPGSCPPATCGLNPASTPPTPLLAGRVGQALLRGRWREAVRLLLTPRPGARADQAEACRLYLEEGDVEGALRLMPRFLVAEPALLQVGVGGVGWGDATGGGMGCKGPVQAGGQDIGRSGRGAEQVREQPCEGTRQGTRLLWCRAARPPRSQPAHPPWLCASQGLKQHGPNGFLNALMCIPRNLRTMYIHAYQSYLVGGGRLRAAVGACGGVFGWISMGWGRQPCSRGMASGRQP